MTPVTFYLRPVARLFQDPMSALTQAADLLLLNNLRAALPEWYLNFYGRHDGLWLGREHLMVLLTLPQPAPLISLGMGLILRTECWVGRGRGLDMSEVIANRQGGRGPWTLSTHAIQLGYPLDCQILQELRLAFPVQIGVN